MMKIVGHSIRFIKIINCLKSTLAKISGKNVLKKFSSSTTVPTRKKNQPAYKKPFLYRKFVSVDRAMGCGSWVQFLGMA